MHKCFYIWLVGFLTCASLPAAPLVFFEDHFSGAQLGANWYEEDGYKAWNAQDTNNFATYQMTGTHLRISIPAGAEHNQYNSEHASVVHRTFMGSGTYEAKIDTTL